MSVTTALAKAAALCGREPPPDPASAPAGARLMASAQPLIELIKKIHDPRDALNFRLTCKKARKATQGDLLYKIDARFHSGENQEVGPNAHQHHTTVSREPCLVWAIREEKDLKKIEKMIDAYAEVDRDVLAHAWVDCSSYPGQLYSPLALAITAGDLDIVEYIMSKGIDINTYMQDPHSDSVVDETNSPFNMACHGDYEDIAIFMIYNGLEIGVEELADAYLYDLEDIVNILHEQEFFNGPDHELRIEEARALAGYQDVSEDHASQPPSLASTESTDSEEDAPITP